MQIKPKELLALAYRVSPGDGCICAICGPSVFDAGSKGLGTNFTNFDALEGTTDNPVCQGCEQLLSGRPGDDPSPLRTISFCLGPISMDFKELSREDWWNLVSGEVEAHGILSWATSRKRHHWLYAGYSVPDQWEVGSDDGRISWEHNAELSETIIALLQLGCTKGEILTGRYGSFKLSQEIQKLDQALESHRQQPILDLVVWAAPKTTNTTQENIEPMIDPVDDTAAELLSMIAWRSTARVDDGIGFWEANGFFIRRLRRFSHRGLSHLVSRLMDQCGVGADVGRDVAKFLAGLSEPEETEIMRAIRDRADLISALSFDKIQAKKEPRNVG